MSRAGLIDNPTTSRKTTIRWMAFGLATRVANADSRRWTKTAQAFRRHTSAVASDALCENRAVAGSADVGIDS